MTVYNLRSFNIFFLISLALLVVSIASIAAASINQSSCTVDFGIFCILRAVPVPAAIWLLGTALIGLVSFGKPKKAA